MQGTYKLLGADDKGRSNRAEFTFTSFVTNKGAGDKEVLPANTVVVQEFLPGGNVSYYRKDSIGLTNEALESLNEVFGAQKGDDKKGDDDNVDDDAVFGTSGKKVVGDSWPVNKAMVVKSFNQGANDLFTVKEENVSGTVKFTKVVKEAGITYLDLDAEVSFTFTIPPKDVGNWAMLSMTGSGTITQSHRLPADNSTGPVRLTYSTDMKMDMTIHVGGQVIKANVVTKDSKSLNRKYSSAGGKNDGDKGKKSRASLPQCPVEGLPRLEVALVAPVERYVVETRPRRGFDEGQELKI